MLFQVFHVAGHVEVDAILVGLEHLGQDGPGDDVARGQIGPGIVALHEGFTGRVDKPRPPASAKPASVMSMVLGPVKERGRRNCTYDSL